MYEIYFQCKDKVPDSLYPKILNCYNSEEGWDLFDKNGNKTNSFFFTTTNEAFVPYVSFNNVSKRFCNKINIIKILLGVTDFIAV